MIQPFTFEMTTAIEFGCGKSKEIGAKIQELGVDKVLVVTDAQLMRLGLLEKILKSISDKNIAYIIYDKVLPNPRAEQVDECAALYVEKECRMILAVGGGSVMDVAKGAAVIAANGGEIMDYMLLRQDQRKECENMPETVIAVPTTSGTGSEVSECIVITDKNHKKDLMLTPKLAPKYAYVDPELTYGVPSYITATTGLDVLGHAIESYVSNLENKIAELFALEAIRLTFANLPSAVEGNEAAKVQMSLACVYAGIAQSKNGCILPHAVSCPLSVKYKIPHGYAVGIAQIPSIEYTADVSAQKYEEIIQYMGMDKQGESASVLLMNKIHELFVSIGLKEKISIGTVDEKLIDELTEDAMLEIDIEDCPRQPVLRTDVAEIYKKILE